MRRSVLGSLFLALVGLTSAFGQSPQAAQPAPQPAADSACAALATMALPNVRIADARVVPAGGFTPPAGTSRMSAAEAAFYKELPPFCRVSAVSSPSTDSSIKIEVWMPLAAGVPTPYNGRFRGQGNGGFAGSFTYRVLGAMVQLGYATAQTDTGHTGEATDATWALGHPEKIVDFGYRGVHEMTVVAKAVIAKFYGASPQHSYFFGCSNGGRQALMEAQRYPGDYDGILAGAPANAWTSLVTSGVFDAKALTEDAASYIPASKLPAIAKAVNKACDAQDGVADGVLNDPRACRFDPATLLCAAEDSDACLTAAQVTTLKKLYEGARDENGRRIFPGFLPGAEEGPGGWTSWITGAGPGRGTLFAFASGFFRNMVYANPGWNYRGANLAQAFKDAQERLAATLDSANPDLAAFKSHGGKLILFHGWNDPAISALNTVNYFDQVASRAGGTGAAQSFVRLYMAPGVQHCSGGPGPDAFTVAALTNPEPSRSLLLALERWVEKEVAPDTVIATRTPPASDPSAPKRARPLCPYPQVAEFKGGDPNEPASYACAVKK